MYTWISNVVHDALREAYDSIKDTYDDLRSYGNEYSSRTVVIEYPEGWSVKAYTDEPITKIDDDVEDPPDYPFCVDSEIDDEDLYDDEEAGDDLGLDARFEKLKQKFM